jgi:hypothetical protein
MVYSPLDEERVRQTNRKNASISYGLTLVIGLPFPAEITSRIQDIQHRLETLLPGHFTWYGADHLHATLLALLRGRYRDQPPLRREELPTDLQSFVYDLGEFFARFQPFPLELAGMQITEEGSVVVREDTIFHQLASVLRRYPELDQPKYVRGLHVCIGFLNRHRPFLENARNAQLTSALSQIVDLAVGRMTVRRAWLVHYSNRTLSQIVGKVSLAFGQDSKLTSRDLLRALDIADA